MNLHSALTVIGTVAIDTVETPFGKRSAALGGSATYFSATASFFTPLSLVAVIGQDFPEDFLDFFKNRPIDLTGLQRLPGNSFRWSGRYDHDLNTAHTLKTELNVLSDLPRVSART